MASEKYSYPRPELKPTIVFGGKPALDDQPFVTPSGRLVPGPRFSVREYEVLRQIVENRSDNFASPLPTSTQLARISLSSVSGCWELPTYQDTKNRARYGQLSVQGIENPSSLAHRTMYMIFYGLDSLPNGRHDYLDHLCENKSCCYPRHVEVTTHKINTHRGRVSKLASTGQMSFEFED